MSTTWILVAHRSGARFFSSRGPNTELTLVDDVDHAEGRLRAGDIDADRPGRVHDRVGEQRHGVSSEESPTEHLAVEFAKALAGRLKSAQEAGQFQRLVLVAGPKFLGHLRDALDSQTAALVTASLDKNLGGIAVGELAGHLREVL